MSKKRWKGLAIDADFLLYETAEGKFQTGKGIFGEEEGEVADKGFKEPLKPYKERFKTLLKDVIDTVYANAPGQIGKKVKVLFTDPDNNFRYEIYPEYKSNRRDMQKSDVFYRLRKWVHKKYGFVKGAEADDACGYYAKKGYLTASMDKDVLYSIPGAHFDLYHMRRHFIETGELEARNFTYKQCLMGDAGDGIPGIPRVGEKTAIKLLDEFGWDEAGVIKAYESKGLTADDALLTMRLVRLDQWHPKKGVRLFEWSV
jgi:5'-3' exonuclease